MNPGLGIKNFVVETLNTADMTGLMSLLQQLLGDRFDFGNEKGLPIQHALKAPILRVC